jgi:hypothetical protein
LADHFPDINIYPQGPIFMNSYYFSPENVRLPERLDIIRKHEFEILTNAEKTERARVFESLTFTPSDTVNSLKKNGVASFATTDLSIDRSKIGEENLNLIASSQSSKSSGKKYLRTLTKFESYSSLGYSATLDLAFNPKLISNIAAYFGMFPVLWDISVLHSVPTDGAPPSYSYSHSNSYSGSQLWHRDAEDYINLKLFYLLDYVDLASGPTTVLPLAASTAIAEKLDYCQGIKLSDSPVFDDLRSEQIVLTGSPNDSFFVDTDRCFHYGSRISGPTKERYVLLLHYVTPYCLYFWPKKIYQHSPDLIKIPKSTKKQLASKYPFAEMLLHRRL